jgi:hypothetical protein
MESTRGLDSWMAASLRHLGDLRRLIRDVDGGMEVGGPAARESAAHMKSKVEMMQSHLLDHADMNQAEWAVLTKNIESLIHQISRPGPHAGTSTGTSTRQAEMLERTRDDALREAAGIQSRILRLRRSSDSIAA